MLQKKKKELSLFQRLKMARDAALGVSWLHYNNIIHRDIKPENMLVDSHYRVKGTPLSLIFSCRFRFGDAADQR